VSATIASVFASILASADAVGHDGGGADDCGGTGDRGSDDSSSCCSCGTQWHGSVSFCFDRRSDRLDWNAAAGHELTAGTASS